MLSPHLLLGNPSGATPDPANRTNYLMLKPYFALSYNDANGTANWVSWRLTRADLGEAPRRPEFESDRDLPRGFKRVTHRDYSGSGFDRGHLCNSKDRTNNRTNNAATFNMTNILPQRPGNNQGPWKALEDFSRALARQNQELYIVAGGYGSLRTIAGGKVNVPKTFWKVIVVLPKGDDDLSRIGADARAIAVCMPNRNSIRRNNWRRYVTTIRNVEAATGFDFLSELSAEIQDAVENRRDPEASGRPTTNPCQ